MLQQRKDINELYTNPKVRFAELGVKIIYQPGMLWAGNAADDKRELAKRMEFKIPLAKNY